MKVYKVERGTQDTNDKLWFTNKSEARKQVTIWRRDPDTVQVFNVHMFEIETSRKGIIRFLNSHTQDWA